MYRVETQMENCACLDFLEIQSESELGKQLSTPHYDDSDDENEIFHDAEAELATSDQESDSGSGGDAWMLECEKLVSNVQSHKKKDPFWDIVVLLHRAQARVWLGTYEPSDSICGTCFLKREGYIDEGADDVPDFFASMPTSFRS